MARSIERKTSPAIVEAPKKKKWVIDSEAYRLPLLYEDILFSGTSFSSYFYILNSFQVNVEQRCHCSSKFHLLGLRSMTPADIGF